MARQVWRRWVRVIHRDLGYVCAGLTVLYAVSGVAVNHVADWNPSYSVERREFQVEPVAPGALAPEQVAGILAALPGADGAGRTFQPDPGTLKVLSGERSWTVDLARGRVVEETVRERPILFESNFLHLNHPKRLWTWVADLFAVSLAVLALTGILILPGRQGLAGRGKWLTALGILIPLLFLWLYR